MTEQRTRPPKQLVWMGDSLDRLRSFPPEVREVFGFAWYQAQLGAKHFQAKPLRGFGTGVLEIVANSARGTFRVVYTVRLGDRVYVLHAF